MAGTTKRTLALLTGTTAFAIAAVSAASAQVTLLDAITIIATRTEQYAIDALAPVSTIREEQIQQLAPTRTNQLFFGIPGVSTEATAQDASTSINIRGVQDFGRVVVLIDGARQNYARLGHEGAGSFFLETEILGGADIVRGPTSNIYGSGAIGGVVSFRTKDVEDILLPNQRWGIQANATGGTNGFNGVASLFAASRISPNAEFLLGGSYRNQDNYRTGNGTRIVNSGQEVETLLAKATFRPAEGHQIKLTGIIYNADWINGTPPGSPTPPTTVQRDFNSLNITTSANWKYRPTNNPLIDFDATAYWNRVDVTSVLLRYSVTPPSATNLGIYGPVGTRTNYLIDTLGFDVNNTSRFDTGALRHALTYGADIFQDEVQNSATAGFGAGYNPRGERRVAGGFVQLRSNYSTWLEVISALRYDSYSLDGLNVFSGTNVSTTGDRLSPKITVGLTPWQGFQPYVSYAEGYRAPSVTETLVSGQHPGSAFSSFVFLPNPSLRPEIGKNSEVGLNLKYDSVFVAGDKFRTKMSLFRNKLEDFIDVSTAFVPGVGPCPASPPPPNAFAACAQYLNIQNARIQGFELEGLYDRGLWFVGFSGHVLNGKDLGTGGPLAKIPADMFSTTVGGRFLDQRFTIAVRWMAVAAKKAKDVKHEDPPGPVGLSPVVPLTRSYNLVNLYLGYQIDPTLLASFSVENILNEQYTVFTHEYASPGVTFKLGLRKLFGPAPDITTVNNLNTANLRPQAAR